MSAIIIILVVLLAAVIIYSYRQKKIIEELEKISIYDALTGIFNHRFLEMELLRIIKGIKRKIVDENKQNAQSTHRRRVKPLSFVMIDFDGLKGINDTWGHPVGNIFITSIANSLTAIAHRSGDILARYGGDEFSVILPETNFLAAQEIAEKMRLKVEETNVETKDGPKSTTISSGVITVSDFADCEDVTGEEIVAAIIRYADKLLYQAKKTGRNRVVGENMTLKEILAELPAQSNEP